MTSADDAETYRRRGLLAAAGTAVLASLGGCSALADVSPDRHHESDADLSGPGATWPGKMGGSARRSAVSRALPDAARGRGVDGLSGVGRRRPVVGPDALVAAGEAVRLPGDDDPAGRVVAVDRETGDVRWQYRLSNANTYPAVAGDTVFAQGDRLVALDRRDGRLRWRYDVGYAWWQTAPTPARGTLLVTAAEPEAVWGLDPSTGRRRWAAGLSGREPRGLAADPHGAAYVASAAPEERRGSLFRIDPADGTVRWRRPAPTDPVTPVAGPTRVYVHADGRLVARHADDGALAWRRSLPRVVRRGGPALGPERCFVVSRDDDGDGRLYALRRDDGATDWRGPTVPVPPVAAGAVTVTDDRVYVPVTAGETSGADSDTGPGLAALDPATGQRVATLALPGHPATGAAVGDGGGALVVDDGSDRLVALG